MKEKQSIPATLLRPRLGKRISSQCRVTIAGDTDAGNST